MKKTRVLKPKRPTTSIPKRGRGTALAVVGVASRERNLEPPKPTRPTNKAFPSGEGVSEADERGVQLSHPKCLVLYGLIHDTGKIKGNTGNKEVEMSAKAELSSRETMNPSATTSHRPMQPVAKRYEEISAFFP